MTLEWKVRSYRSENGRKIMSEDRRSLENKDFLQISQLVLHSIYDYAVSFVAGGVVRFYFLHKRHISIPFGPISRGTDANEVFVYVHTKNVFAQRLLGAVRVFL